MAKRTAKKATPIKRAAKKASAKKANPQPPVQFGVVVLLDKKKVVTSYFDKLDGSYVIGYYKDKEKPTKFTSKGVTGFGCDIAIRLAKDGCTLQTIERGKLKMSPIETESVGAVLFEALKSLVDYSKS